MRPDEGGWKAGDLATGGLGPGHQPLVTPPTTHPGTEYSGLSLDFEHYYYTALN